MLPRTHVLRLFLTPDDLPSSLVPSREFAKKLLMEWIDLLETDEGAAVAPSILLPVCLNVVIDLSTTENQPLDFLGICWLGAL